MQGDAEYNDLYPDDERSRLNHPGIKIVLNGVTAFLLGMHFDVLSDAYFSSVAIFVIPMLFEYFGFVPKDSKRHILYAIERIILIAIGLVCILGLCGIFHIQSGKNEFAQIYVTSGYAILPGAGFPALILFILILLSFAIAVIDFAMRRTKFDSKFNQYPAAATSK